jgi:hypothetical protein
MSQMDLHMVTLVVFRTPTVKISIIHRLGEITC